MGQKYKKKLDKKLSDIFFNFFKSFKGIDCQPTIFRLVHKCIISMHLFISIIYGLNSSNLRAIRRKKFRNSTVFFYLIIIRTFEINYLIILNFSITIFSTLNRMVVYFINSFLKYQLTLFSARWSSSTSGSREACLRQSWDLGHGKAGIIPR